MLVIKLNKSVGKTDQLENRARVCTLVKKTLEIYAHWAPPIMVGTHCRALKSSVICSLWRQIRPPGLFRRSFQHLLLQHLVQKLPLHLKFTTVKNFVHG